MLLRGSESENSDEYRSTIYIVPIYIFTRGKKSRQLSSEEFDGGSNKLILVAAAGFILRIFQVFLLSKSFGCENVVTESPDTFKTDLEWDYTVYALR